MMKRIFDLVMASAVLCFFSVPMLVTRFFSDSDLNRKG